MRNLNNGLSSFLVLIFGLIATFLEVQTSAAEELQSIGITDPLILNVTPTTPVTQADCTSQDLSNSGNRKLSGVTLRSVLNLHDLDSEVRWISVQCILLEPNETFLDVPTRDLGHLIPLETKPAIGETRCQAGDLRAASVDIPIYIAIGKKASQYDKYQCDIKFSVESEGLHRRYLPSTSIDAPIPIVSKQGSEFVVELKGNL